MKQHQARLGCVLLATLLASACSGSAGLSGSQDEESVKIGAMFPLTGEYAAIGVEERRGLQMAMDQIKQVQVDGRPVQVLTEDTAGDTDTSISAAQKLLTSEQVDALIGGYSSTTGQATMNAIAGQKPLTVWSGVSSSEVEGDLAGADWFFHLHPWDYHYQQTIGEFLAQIEPAPRTVALAYEDQLYGTTQAKIARTRLRDLGVEVVMDEPFTSGASDYTGLLTKVKQADPDVFYWIGYEGDAILLTRQAKQLGVSPKLMLDTVGVGVPEYAKAVGDQAEGVTGIEVWTPGVSYPGSQASDDPLAMPSTKEWVADYRERFGRDPNYWAVIAYVNAITVVDAMRDAGTTDKQAVMNELDRGRWQTPMGPLDFSPSRQLAHQGFESTLVFQYQGGQKKVLWPEQVANGQLRYPFSY